MPKSHDINAICPYYTMYPLDFPLRVLGKHNKENDWILDPFCGRGTTNYAARLLGLPSVGYDSSPIAVSIAKAKLANTTIHRVLSALQNILYSEHYTPDIPQGTFWELAFHQDTLYDICLLREALLRNCSSDARIVLRALLLGALHGPVNKGSPSYLSNQCVRTFSPKPAYSIKFWKKNKLKPKFIDVFNVIKKRTYWYLSDLPETVDGEIIRKDSRNSNSFNFRNKFSWVISSPPYYGMRTYIQDQWLRNWFLGGPGVIDYAQRKDDFQHSTPDDFVSQLRDVWRNAANASKSDARLACRFGGINDRNQDPLSLIKESLKNSGWRVSTIKVAGTALDGKRQAKQFGEKANKPPKIEYDVYARKG